MENQSASILLMVKVLVLAISVVLAAKLLVEVVTLSMVVLLAAVGLTWQASVVSTVKTTSRSDWTIRANFRSALRPLVNDLLDLALIGLLGQ